MRGFFATLIMQLRGHCPTPSPLENETQQPTLSLTTSAPTNTPTFFSAFKSTVPTNTPTFISAVKPVPYFNTNSFERSGSSNYLVIYTLLIFTIPCLICFKTLMRYCLVMPLLPDYTEQTEFPPNSPVPISTEARKQYMEK